MAIRHGLAGKYPKSQATQRYFRLVLMLFGFGSYGVGVFGFFAGYTWREHGPLVALITALICFAVFVLVWRKASRYMDRMAKERIRLLKGGRGEALIAWLLEDLDDEWHIFNGIKPTKDSDIDHVVVGPGGVFCISTKSQHGIFSGTREGVNHNGEPCDFARDAMRQAMWVKDLLAEEMNGRAPWIQPVLAVPFGFTERDACDGKVLLVHQYDINERIAPENLPKELDKEKIQRVVGILEVLRVGARIEDWSR
jgi:nuclease-like protein